MFLYCFSAVNRVLKTLNVSGNDLTPRCLMYFQTMLHDNETLREYISFLQKQYYLKIVNNVFFVKY